MNGNAIEWLKCEVISCKALPFFGCEWAGKLNEQDECWRPVLGVFVIEGCRVCPVLHSSEMYDWTSCFECFSWCVENDFLTGKARFPRSSAVNHRLWRNFKEKGVCLIAFKMPVWVLTLTLKPGLIDGRLWMPLGCFHGHTEHSPQALAGTGNK